MTDVWRLVQAETSKVTQRRFWWALLAILVLASILHARGLKTSLLDFRQAIDSGVGRHGEAVPRDVALAQQAGLERRMTFPDILDEVWAVTRVWGVFAVLIGASIQAGEEFDSGTGRTLLLRGVGRTAWPVSKVLAYLFVAGLAWLLLAIVQIPIGFWTQAQIGTPTGGAGLATVHWTGYGARWLREWMATLPNVGLATGFALFARGAGPALALTLGLRFVEITSDGFGPFLVSMRLSGIEAFDGLYRVWAPIHMITMDWNARLWGAWGGSIWSEALLTLPGGGHEPLPAPFHTDPVVAGCILLVWSAFWIRIGTWSLKRRDVTT